MVALPSFNITDWPQASREAGLTPDDRSQLLDAVVTLCEAGHPPSTVEAEALLDNVFLDLIKTAETEVRQRLADRLAAAPWAPSGLIHTLALDDIEIARPVIAKSPVLGDRDLIFLLTAATIEHQIEVARRPMLGEPVVDAILDQADPAVLTALAGNITAKINEPGMARLVGLSRGILSLRAPLARHPGLTRQLASTLYAWVGEALRSEIAGRFKVNGSDLDEAMRASVEDTLNNTPPREGQGAVGETDQAEMESRLIAKLQAAGQLRPGFLLRTLRQGNLRLFELALACLANVKTEAVEAAANSDRPELLALACAGVGIDRSVFPSILSFVRALNQSHPTPSPGSDADISAAFAIKGETAAITAFKAGVVALESRLPRV